MNNAFSSYFFSIYDRLLYFGGRNGLLRIVLKNTYIFLMLGKWVCSSVAVNSTADRDVDGKYNG